MSQSRTVTKCRHWRLLFLVAGDRAEEASCGRIDFMNFYEKKNKQMFLLSLCTIPENVNMSRIRIKSKKKKEKKSSVSKFVLLIVLLNRF